MVYIEVFAGVTRTILLLSLVFEFYLHVLFGAVNKFFVKLVHGVGVSCGRW